MKLYKIITEYHKYRLAVLIPLLSLYLWGALEFLFGRHAKLPTILFLIALLTWGAIWLIGWFSYKNYLTNGSK